MKFGVVTFPGSNCDYDNYMAIKERLLQPVEFIWHKDADIGTFDCICLPGGFSYGDYLRSGAIARFSPVMRAVIDYANRGGLVIGICNGFQVLLESGLLPGAMLRNRSLRFICKYIYLRCENNSTPFTNQIEAGEVVKIPIAHADGNYYSYNGDIKELTANGQVIFRYCTPAGKITDAANPNGSTASIAGICNRKGNVLGMMPHPERAAETLLGSEDGLKVFASTLAALKSGVARVAT
ncbi:MAG: phosphoribosylformylglycinamidine synthase subunit PurQ [candidate division Zixibacteria bacterium]|nr:phosphoribosylformylglycinamidine synthase subunit PurQ [candidate division Zixibacteria bacterium]